MTCDIHPIDKVVGAEAARSVGRIVVLIAKVPESRILELPGANSKYVDAVLWSYHLEFYVLCTPRH